jgi:TolB-like protein
VVTAWLLLQVVDVISVPLHLPEWFGTMVVVLLALGFPIALVIAWAFEITPDGVQRSSDTVDALAIPPGQSRIDYVIVGLLVVAIGFMVYTSQFIGPADDQKASVAPTSGGPVVLRNSIAVLPFENLSPNPDDAYFAAGIHEETLNQLAKIKDLSVIARTTMMRYTDSEKSVPEIASELNVGTVLEGSVRYEEDRVRITAQLIDAETGAHLWSEAYDRELRGVFAIQSDIALKITEAMKAEFEIAEQKSVGRALTDNLEAYAAYVRALAAQQMPAPDIRKVLQHLDTAIALDPKFAEALATKAQFHALINVYADETFERTKETQAFHLAQAESLANRALALDPEQGTAYAALVIVEESKRNWSKAYANIQRAYALSPSAVTTFQYAALSAQRRLNDLAIELANRAIALDPLNPNLALFAAPYAADMQLWGKAEEFSRRALPMMPNFYLPYLQISYWAVLSGDRQKAHAMAEQGEALWEGSLNPNSRVAMMDVYRRLGRPDDVKRLFAELQRIATKRKVHNGEWARAYAALGDTDRAVDYLAKVVEENFPIDYVLHLHFNAGHPYYDSFRDHPGFQKILNEIEATST